VGAPAQRNVHTRAAHPAVSTSLWPKRLKVQPRLMGLCAQGGVRLLQLHRLTNQAGALQRCACAALRSSAALFRRDARRRTRHLQTTDTGSKDKDLPVGKRIYHIQRLLSEAERIMRQQPPLVWHDDGSFAQH
jgi:hypothetical protein